MAHFSYTRTGGLWGPNGVDTITEADLESFEQKMFKAINGDEGGAWSPSSAIAIGGSGVDLQGTGHQVSSGGKLAIKSGATLDIENSGTHTYGTTNGPKLASRSLARTHAFTPSFSDATKFSVSSSVAITVGSVAADNMTLAFDLPHGCTLNAVHVLVRGQSTGAPTGTMPKLSVYRHPTAGGTGAQIGTTTTDGSATEAAYEVDHLLSVSGLSEVIDREQYTYHAYIECPFGGTQQLGFRVNPCWTQSTHTSMDVGAA